MEKRNYSINFEQGICIEPCEYIKDKRIGSMGCQNCNYCILSNFEKRYVYCGYKNKIKKSDKPILIYYAGALFSLAEQKFNEMLAIKITNSINNSHLFLPQKKCKGLETSTEIYNKCVDGIIMSDIVVAILDGTDVDSGTAWEIGYATKSNIPIIGIRTDFRQRGDDVGLNCMISKSLYHLIESDNVQEIGTELTDIISDLVEKKIIKGKNNENSTDSG